MIFLAAVLAVAAVLAGFWLLQRHVERACHMHPDWLEDRYRRAHR